MHSYRAERRAQEEEREGSEQQSYKVSSNEWTSSKGRGKGGNGTATVTVRLLGIQGGTEGTLGSSLWFSVREANQWNFSGALVVCLRLSVPFCVCVVSSAVVIYELVELGSTSHGHQETARKSRVNWYLIRLTPVPFV